MTLISDKTGQFAKSKEQDMSSGVCYLTTIEDSFVLGQDIARALNTAGYLKTLKRTSVGDYSYKSSKGISELEKEWKHISN